MHVRFPPTASSGARRCQPWWRAWLGCVLAIVLGWTPHAQAQAPQAPTLHLGASASSVDAWPAMRVLYDKPGLLNTADALQRLSAFEAPQTPRSNLGASPGVTWIHVPFVVDPGGPSSWMLRLHYALLHQVDVKVFDDTGQLVHAATMGSRIPYAQREQPTRALTTRVHVEPVRRYDLLLRIDTATALLVPLAFMQPSALGVEESNELALQGFMSGLWFFMVVYSLINALFHRDIAFLAYALTLLSSWTFAQAIFGVGAMHVWPNSSWLAAHASVMSPLWMVIANVGFYAATLDLPRKAPRVMMGMGAMALVALLVSAGIALEWFSYRVGSAVSMGLTAAHVLVVLPVIVQRARRGEKAAGFLLTGSCLNLTGMALMAYLLRGGLPFSFMTMHIAQMAFAAEMVTWLLVLAAKLEQIRAAARAARQEHATLHALAHTDALTGLLNRRGLEQALGERLGDADTGAAPATHERQAIFLLDLDGFKPVNDQWGHPVGDELLRQVAQRLLHAVRPGDLVARFGGDEFVVAIAGLPHEETAAAVGRKLLSQFSAPFDLGEGRRVNVGATIGYSTTGRHGHGVAQLLRCADQAMYAGKQAGKQMLMAAPATA